MSTIFVVGHSTRPIESFVDLLKAHSIDFLVDIRTIPKSRHNPQFNEESLKKKLHDNKIGYLHVKGLGGLRHPDKDSINLGWHNMSFRGFADYMQTKEFDISLKELIALSKRHTIAIMCAEGNPFRCHRSLVADALLVRHVKALHISSKVSAREHVLTPFAKVKGRSITYP
ncbi:MAG: DUF488 domain-containing protein [Thaumarchaeota archaeon]|nr:DUF488 domain-containing protein [Nitrososphaerota archaeon]MDE1873310.1 DUF488 domain-containing protein [Nitrososphaerota archaeon]